MNVDSDLAKHIVAIFNPLNKSSAAKAFPPPLELSKVLEGVMPTKEFEGSSNVDSAVPRLFATAAVDAWLRSVHGFLVSASLTDASPVWSSVSGYYSSHYCVRAIAHLLGHFQLYHRKRNVKFELSCGGQFVCNFDKKAGGEREHKIYWKFVKEHPFFRPIPIFSLNNSDASIDASDAGHRERMNYGDHIAQTPKFRNLDLNALKERINFISQIHFTTPPIPKKSKAPDLESVQVIAYHRIVFFRRLLDEVLDPKNRFWSVHRSPAWVEGMTDFQLTEQGDLGALNN